MSIVSSTYTLGGLQIDGRRYVTEYHTDHLAEVHTRDYGPVPVIDYQAVADAYAIQLNESLAEQEVFTALSMDATPVVAWNTSGQFLDRLRSRYKSSSERECARIAWWIIRRIAAGDITDTQLRNAFELTTPQYNSLKTKLQSLHDGHQLISTAAGE